MWENALSIFLYGGQASEITATHGHTHTFLYMCVHTGPCLRACISTVVHAYKCPPHIKCTRGLHMHMHVEHIPPQPTYAWVYKIQPTYIHVYIARLHACAQNIYI